MALTRVRKIIDHAGSDRAGEIEMHFVWFLTLSHDTNRRLKYPSLSERKDGMERAYKSVRQLLAAKVQGVYTVGIKATVWDALSLMAEKDVGAVLVVDGDALAGVFSERDYARKGIIAGRTARETPIGDVMTSLVITVTPGHGVPQCMALMTAHRIRHLPVIEDGRLVGVLSIGDLVKEVISHHEHVIKDMELERLILFSQGTYSC